MNNNFKKPYRPQQKKREHLINSEITHPIVRITGDEIESKVLAIHEALKMAREAGVDLVEVSPNANPPVCKIIDYNKFIYDKKQKDKENKKKQENNEVKELRFTPTTDDHDFTFKTRHAIAWLKDGCKVKAVVVFKGRMIQQKEMGEIMLLKLAQIIDEYGKLDQLPKLEGFKMTMIISPKKKK